MIGRRLAFFLGAISCVGLMAVCHAAVPARKAPALVPTAPASVEEVAAGIYMVTVEGVNVVVQAGPEGAVVVDTGPLAASGALLKAIRGITDKPIRGIRGREPRARRADFGASTRSPANDRRRAPRS